MAGKLISLKVCFLCPVSRPSYPPTYFHAQVSISKCSIKPLCILLQGAECLPIRCACSLGRSLLRVHARTLNLYHNISVFHSSTLSTNCDTSVNFNAGCGVSFTNSSPSYGTTFNMNGGGYFAMVRSRTLGVKIYFWSRNSADIPPEIRKSRSGILYPDPSWGVPAADFPMYPDFCNYDDHFNAHQIVFDLTFCVSDLFYLSCTFLPEHD